MPFTLVVSAAAAASSSATGCHLRSPRRCGPLISPGGHQLSMLAPDAHPPPNLLYVSRMRPGATSHVGAGGPAQREANASRALVCVPAKAGSTSFYFWLYAALAGVQWPYSGPPWIQDVSSDRWAGGNLTGVRLARFAALPYRQRARILSDANVKRFALTRDPLERALSAYYSKVACDTGDKGDHAGVIHQLLKQAPRALAAGLGAGSYPNRSVPCLSASDFARMVLEARLNPNTRWQVNSHFMPQSDSCGLHTIGYHMLVPLEDNAYGMARLAGALGLADGGGSDDGGGSGVGSSSVARLGKRHVVAKSDKRAVSQAAMALLAKAYVQDLNLLQFPSSWGNWSTSRATGGAAAAEAARRAAKPPLKVGGKGGGKGAGGKGTGGKGAGAAKGPKGGGGKTKGGGGKGKG